MSGLVKKDFYIMRALIKPINYILILLAVLAAFIFYREIGGMYVALFLPLLITGFNKTIMVYDTQCRWDKMAIALPVTRKKIVASKYLFFVILATLASAIALSLCIVTMPLFDEMTLDLCVKFVIAGFLLSVFYGLLIIPSCYAWGSNGGQLSMFLSVALFLFIVYMLKKANIDLENLGVWLANNAIIIIIVALAFISIISYNLSVYFYTKVHS